MPNRAQGGTPSAQNGLLTAWRRHLRARTALAALAATAALGIGATPATATDWGYEQISPAGGSAISVFGIRVSPDLSTVLATTIISPMGGMPWDGRARVYWYGLPRGGTPWTLGPTEPINGIGLQTSVGAMSPDGSRMLYNASLPSVDGASSGVYRVDAQGGAVNIAPGLGASVYVADANADAVAFLSGAAPQAVYLSRPGQAPVRVSVDNDGNPMTATALGGSTVIAGAYGNDVMFGGNAFAADGSSVIFTSTDGLAGDNDVAHASPGSSVGFKDLYRRVLTPGHEETYAISDANGAGDDDAGVDAEYRWATADQSRVFFVTSESLVPGDTDGQQDIYMREGKNAPVWVSQGETVDGAPTGNGSNPPLATGQPDTEWLLSSRDGNRTVFATAERLTQDAPAAGIKLYERDVAEGRTRLVAGPLSIADTISIFSPPFDSFATELNFRSLRVTPSGVVLQTRAPLAGTADDGTSKVFVWTRGGGLRQIDVPGADVPPSIGTSSILPMPLAATEAAYSFDIRAKPGRAVSDDGSRVFFSTGRALTAQDTDGNHVDIYMWTAAGGVQLVTPPGRAPYDVSYVDSSPDGSQVWFSTEESILSSDTDPNAIDVYKATLGGGSPPSPQVPDADPWVCGGEACQGPIAPLVVPSIGSVSFAGPGNVPAVERGAGPSVSVSKVKTVTGSVARLQVKVPVAGEISVAGGSLRSAGVSASKPGSYAVRIALSSAAKKSLKRKKTLKVSARVSFRAADGDVVSTTVSMTFKQPKAKPAATKKGGR